MNLSYNFIHKEGAHHIAQLLKNTTVVTKLSISRNPIGEDGLKSLCDALSTSTFLDKLKLSSCSLTLHEENGLLLRQLLDMNKSLTSLNLSLNIVTDCNHIAAGLSNNKTLRTLILRHCSLTDQSIQALSTGLNNYIEELNIGDNNLITENGLEIFARHLTTLSGLRRLIMPNNLESSINSVFSEVNEERRRNGFPKIKLTGECNFKYTNLYYWWWLCQV